MDSSSKEEAPSSLGISKVCTFCLTINIHSAFSRSTFMILQLDWFVISYRRQILRWNVHHLHRNRRLLAEELDVAKRRGKKFSEKGLKMLLWRRPRMLRGYGLLKTSRERRHRQRCPNQRTNNMYPISRYRFVFIELTIDLCIHFFFFFVVMGIVDDYQCNYQNRTISWCRLSMRQFAADSWTW